MRQIKAKELEVEEKKINHQKRMQAAQEELERVKIKNKNDIDRAKIEWKKGGTQT